MCIVLCFLQFMSMMWRSTWSLMWPQWLRWEEITSPSRADFGISLNRVYPKQSGSSGPGSLLLKDRRQKSWWPSAPAAEALENLGWLNEQPSHPSVFMSWFTYVHVDLLLVRGRVQLRQDFPGDASLLMTEFQLNDVGRYRCEVVDGLEDKSAVVDLQLQGISVSIWSQGHKD